jgi:serine/threonine protein kinase
MKLKNVQREIKILSKLRHPNIIKLFQVLESENQVHLIMEYMPNLPLNDFMKTRSTKRLSEEESKKIVV